MTSENPTFGWARAMFKTVARTLPRSAPSRERPVGLCAGSFNQMRTRLLLSEFEQRCSEGVDIDVDALTRPWSDQGPSSDAKLMLFEDAPVRSPMMIPQEHAIAGCGEILGTGEQGAATSRCCEGRCAGGWRGAEDSVQEEGPERLHTTKRSIGGPFGRCQPFEFEHHRPIEGELPFIIEQHSDRPIDRILSTGHRIEVSAVPLEDQIVPASDSSPRTQPWYGRHVLTVWTLI